MSKQKIGFTASSFDLLHAGHVAMLKESKENCDYLIVGLNTNPHKNGRYPVQNIIERYAQLEAIKYIDKIIPYNNETELVDLLKLYHIDIRFIGDDYKGKSFTGDDIPMEIFHNSRNHRFSSSALKAEVVKNQKEQSLTGDIIKDNETYTLIDNTELKNLVVSSTVLKPSQHTNGHKHDGIEEVYIFQSGFGKMEVGKEKRDVRAGDTVIIPDGAFHKVYNDSSNEDFSFIAIFNDKRNH